MTHKEKAHGMKKQSKSLECETCFEKFEVEDELNEHIDIFDHMTTRTKRAYKCQKCPMEYPSSMRLKAHERRIHSKQ